MDPVPGLERVAVFGVGPYRRVHTMQLLFYVRVDLYPTRQRLFACLGEMPAKGLPPVVDIPDEAFAALSSVCTVP